MSGADQKEIIFTPDAVRGACTDGISGNFATLIVQWLSVCNPHLADVEIEAGDTRLTNVVFHHGMLWTAHSVAADWGIVRWTPKSRQKRASFKVGSSPFV